MSCGGSRAGAIGRGARLLLCAILLLSGCALVRREQLNLFDSGVRRLAILPIAYRAGVGGYACDLCPHDVEMQETSADDALLATAFFYEAITRHPGYTVIDYETVEPLSRSGMRAAAGALHEQHQVDAVVVTALIDLRPLEGSTISPSKPAGATLYAALIRPETGQILWSDTFDEDEAGVNVFVSRMSQVVRGEQRRWLDAHAMIGRGAHSLVESMVRTGAP